MGWTDDYGWVDRKQGDRAEVLSCDPLRSEGADPRVPVQRVREVQLGFGSSCKVYFIQYGNTRCSLARVCVTQIGVHLGCWR